MADAGDDVEGERTEMEGMPPGASDAAASPASIDTVGVAGNASGDSLWVRKWDDASNSLYYFNLRTQESSWEQPEAYRAVFMSEPLDLETQRAPEEQQEAEQAPDDSAASVMIQSLYRGRKDRKRVQEARKWSEQFDPATSQKYYYNSETGESQWEKPNDLLTGVKDERSARAVKIQSVFRAKKARDRVKQLADEEEEEEEMEQQLHDEEETAAEEAEIEAIAAPEPGSQALWCQYYDPRSRKHYYRHVGTDAITWEKPAEYVSSWVGGSKRDVAALSIQCVARKRIAANDLATKREKMRVLTDPATMELKLGELKQVSMEIETEIETRALASTDEEKQFPHLASLISGWRESLESIKSHIVSLENRRGDILLAKNTAVSVVLAEHFHKALIEMRSECLALLRSILLMNSYFVDLDVSRINAACLTFVKWKAQVCALRDSRTLQIIQGGDVNVNQLLEQAEALLRRSIGLTDYNNGLTSAAGKRYEDWHPSVTAALTGVQEMEQYLARKMHLLRGFREISLMAEEDVLASRVEQQRRRRLNDEMDQAILVVKCQEYWKMGLNQRDDDILANVSLKNSRKQKTIKHQEVPQSETTSDNDKSKLSIWEATKEGLPVEIVRAMVFTEMQKARRLGYDFLVRTARSDRGETLIQIACWWGHEHLVTFFIEEGAQIDGIDSTCNRFSLLHDAARRGHSHVLRILLDRGLSCNVKDSTGETPFHWAARNNNFSAVLSLLGIYYAERDKSLVDEIIKTVRHKNLRGKTACALAKGGRVRQALKSAEEGRLPPLRRPRTSDEKPGISRRMTEIAPRDRTRGNRTPKKGKTLTMLTKSTKHSSTIDLDELVSLIDWRYQLAPDILIEFHFDQNIDSMLPISPPEKVEQLITVFSQRLQPQALQRLSVAEILQDATALSIMKEQIPSMDTIRATKHQKSIFARVLKFLHLHEPTGYEKDEEHKRTAVRYLALRTLLQQCGDINVSSIQEACLDKVLRWFESTEVNAFASATSSMPILPPRMSPKKSSAPPALDKCPSEIGVLPTSSTVACATVAAKLEKYKMPDLRASHIRRIAELRSRGADISEETLPWHEDNNSFDQKPQGFEDRGKTVEDRMIEATFKVYHPETDAEREMNLMWIRRREDEKSTRQKNEEVQQRVQKWAMDRSREESENLRKRESTKLVAGLGQMLQEGINQEKPFAWRSTRSLHPDLAGIVAQQNQSAAVAVKLGVGVNEAKGRQQDDTVSRKLPLQKTYTRPKQPAQIIIKTRKSSSGGMHFRNQLPPNYVPSGLLVASSVLKSKSEASRAVSSTRPSSNSRELSFISLEKNSSDELSSASDDDGDDDDDLATDENVKTKRRSIKNESRQQMKLQSYHVPYYYADGTDHPSAANKGPAKPRSTILDLPLSADPELRCLQEASEMRRVFAIPSEKKHNPVAPSIAVADTEREVLSSRRQKSANKSRSGSKTAKGKRATTSARSGAPLPRKAASYTFAEPPCSASTSDLRHSQMDEVEKIRRLFKAHNLSLPPQALDRGLLVPEDRPLLESIHNLPLAGSRLLSNPLTRRSNAVKAKKKLGAKKKKSKKTKKGSKGVKTPKSSRRAAK